MDLEDWEAAPGDCRSIDPTTNYNYNYHARAPEEESTRPFGRKLFCKDCIGGETTGLQNSAEDGNVE